MRKFDAQTEKEFINDYNKRSVVAIQLTLGLLLSIGIIPYAVLDKLIVHETYKIEWLGYTVNFIEGIDKKELHFRRYNKWQTVNGLLLPKTIVGYGFKDDKPTEAKRTTLFKDIKVSKDTIEIAKFSKPKNANFVN